VAVNVALILCTLACVGVIVTWQDDLSVVAGTAASVQVPVIVSLESEITLTVSPTPGFDFVPVASVSVTVIVAVVFWPYVIGFAAKVTAVEVEQRLTLTAG